MEDIIIFGAGGMGREVAFLIGDINRHRPSWNLLGFADADRRAIGTEVGGFEVICSDEDALEMNVAAAIGIGNPKTIAKIVDRFTGHKNVSFPNLVHPGTVWDRERITMGRGNIICAGTMLTTDISIGSFNLFNLGCTYGHDVKIADCCVFNPGINISGGVDVGSRSLIGTGATILQYLQIGEDVTVGAGAVVTKDVPAGTTVVGVPARALAPRQG